jgi:hypothetical protein
MLKRVFTALLALGWTMMSGCTDHRHQNISSSATISPTLPFERSQWLESARELEPGRQTSRERMIGSIKRLFHRGTPVFEVLKQLGVPDLAQQRGDLGEAHEHQTVAGGLLLAYPISLAPDGWCQDLMFSFDEKGLLQKVWVDAR